MGWDWEKVPTPLLPHGSYIPAQQGSSWAYLFRSVHAVPGFMFQEILFSKVTFATLGTLKWLLSSVFPWDMQIQNPITACQQHLHCQVQEVTGKGEVGASPHSHSATVHSCPKAALMLPLCPLNSTAVSARDAPWTTSFAGPRVLRNTNEAKQSNALLLVVHPGAPHKAQPCVPHNLRNSPPAREDLPSPTCSYHSPRGAPHMARKALGMPFTDI